jgi:hypothetical protein
MRCSFQNPEGDSLANLQRTRAKIDPKLTQFYNASIANLRQFVKVLGREFKKLAQSHTLEAWIHIVVSI